ncbi:MAG: hypothetical protein E7049_11110 [Lentisphaerae bacterium]|nr:hypothetical protein [Lentisphaerota bacterium]
MKFKFSIQCATICFGLGAFALSTDTTDWHGSHALFPATNALQILKSEIKGKGCDYVAVLSCSAHSYNDIYWWSGFACCTNNSCENCYFFKIFTNEVTITSIIYSMPPVLPKLDVENVLLAASNNAFPVDIASTISWKHEDNTWYVGGFDGAERFNITIDDATGCRADPEPTPEWVRRVSFYLELEEEQKRRDSESFRQYVRKRLDEMRKCETSD